MYLHQHEVLVSTVLRDQYRAAERRRLVVAAARTEPRERTTVARLGRLLVRAGGRLETAASARPVAVWPVVGDPCLECGR